MSFHFFLSATNSLHLLTPSTCRSLSTSSFHLFLGLPLLLVSSSSWVKIFLGILSFSILSRWPNQLILCTFIHVPIFSPFIISSSSRFVGLFLSPFSYLGPYLFYLIVLGYNSTYMFRPNCWAVFRVIFEYVESTVDKALNLRNRVLFLIKVPHLSINRKFFLIITYSLTFWRSADSASQYVYLSN